MSELDPDTENHIESLIIYIFQLYSIIKLLQIIFFKFILRIIEGESKRGLGLDSFMVVT